MSRIISDRKTLLGTLYSVGNQQVAEIIAMAGFDWVLVDMEHSVMSLEAVSGSLQALGQRSIGITRAHDYGFRFD